MVPYVCGSRRSGLALDELDHAPPLGLRQRSRLHDPHLVANPVLVVLVVRVVLLAARDALPVERVREAALDQDRHGLVGLVAHDRAEPRLAGVALGDRGGALGPFVLILTHCVFRQAFWASSRSRSTVRRRSE